MTQEVTQDSGSLWHTSNTVEVAQRLKADLARGLTRDEARRRLAQSGPNQLAEAQARPAWRILVDQLRSLIVGLLVAAAGVAFALGDHVEAIAILVVVLINTLTGFFTEWKANRALAALRKSVVPQAVAVREGHEQEIPAVELVPGDLVVLAAGGRVPTDGRIVEAAQLQIDESALTGESVAVDKTSDPLDDAQLGISDRTNMAYMGTTVTNGRGRMLVTETGPRTQLGEIGALIGEAESPRTPLEIRLDQLGQILVLIVMVLCAIVVLAGWLQGATSFWRMVEVGISLAIAAVPEGLPAVATMTLALGMQRMARRGALIRRLPAVETLGSTTVICTDKTGTLTKNEMTATVLVVDHRTIEITGVGYEPRGEFLQAGRTVDVEQDELLALAVRIGCLCNDATVDRHQGEHHALGDPTEAALLVAAEKGLGDVEAIRREYPRVAEVPFDSGTKRMTTVHRTPGGKTLAFVKGSPGTLLHLSKSQHTATGQTALDDGERASWEEANQKLAAAALRVLALAYRDLPRDYARDELDRELVFVGLVGMIDPLREEASEAIAKCRQAGIRAIMITGDQPATASEIARQLGLDVDPQGNPRRTVHGRELAGLDAQGWQAIAAEAAVFARVSPADKLKIVEALQQRGEIVAMTGDGINDAPALKKADIGVAMGVKGTEVAKESAAVVITDDNFATIVTAVEQGRVIYSNILRFIHYLLSCNLSEVLTVFVAILIGWPLPLGALQILWLNMITDVFPALALALEPSSPEAMQRPPINPQRALLSRSFMGLILWQGALLAAATMAAFADGLKKYGSDGEGLRSAVTMAFLTLSLVQILHVFSVRSRIRSAFGDRLLTNVWLWSAVGLCLLLQLATVYFPPLARLLGTSPPDTGDWLVIGACALLPAAVIEIQKLVVRSIRGFSPPPRSQVSTN